MRHNRYDVYLCVCVCVCVCVGVMKCALPGTLYHFWDRLRGSLRSWFRLGNYGSSRESSCALVSARYQRRVNCSDCWNPIWLRSDEQFLCNCILSHMYILTY